MENMGTIFMDIDALNVLAIDIATQMWAFIYHQAGLTCLMRLIGKGGSKQARPDYQVIVMIHIFNLYFKALTKPVFKTSTWFTPQIVQPYLLFISNSLSSS